MDGGLVHQSEGRVTQAVIAALALASLVLQSGGSTPLADTTLNNVLKGYGEKVSPRFTDRTSSRPAASRTESLGRCSSPSARPAYISFVLRKSRLLANDLREESWVQLTLCPRSSESSNCPFLIIAGSRYGRRMCGSGILPKHWWRLGQFVRSPLQKRAFSRWMLTFICALISGFIAVGGLRLGLSRVAGATLIASVIYMLPGIPLINGFIDIASGKHLFAGVQRLFDASVVFFIMTVAVAIANSAL